MIEEHKAIKEEKEEERKEIKKRTALKRRFGFRE
jgi:hypothetical protein